jgi:hypothetical protein
MQEVLLHNPVAYFVEPVDSFILQEHGKFLADSRIPVEIVPGVDKRGRLAHDPDHFTFRKTDADARYLSKVAKAIKHARLRIDAGNGAEPIEDLFNYGCLHGFSFALYYFADGKVRLRGKIVIDDSSVIRTNGLFPKRGLAPFR